MTTCSKGWCALVAIVAIAGCSYDEARFPSQEELFDMPEAPNVFLFRGDGRFFTVKVEGNDITGPEIQLSLYLTGDDPGIRGNIGRRLVTLELHGDQLTGTIGGTPFELTGHRDCPPGNASCEDGALSGQGLVETRTADFRLTPQAFTGRVGRCSYDLHRLDDLTYEGIRRCGGDPIGASVRIPRELKKWPTTPAAAGLAILMSNSD